MYWKERGQSSTTGTVIMVGVVLVLAAVGAAYFTGFASQLRSTSSAGVQIQDNSDGTHTVRLVDSSTSKRVVIRGADGTTRVLTDEGESVTVPSNTSRYSIISVSEGGSETLINQINVENVTATGSPGTVTITATGSATPTATPSPTPTATPSPTPTATPSPTPTSSPTPTPTPTSTTTNTPTPTGAGSVIYEEGHSFDPDAIVSNDNYFVEMDKYDERIDVRNVSDGTLKWNVTSGQDISSGDYFDVSDDKVIYALDAGSNKMEIRARDAATGNILWTSPTLTQIGGLRGMSYDSGTNSIYYHGNDTTTSYSASIVRVDASDGSITYRRNYTERVLGGDSRPRYDSNNFYLPAQNNSVGQGGVIAFSKDTGDIVWESYFTDLGPRGGADNTVFVDTDNDALVMGASSVDDVYVIDKSTGSLQAQKTGFSNNLYSVTADGTHIYVLLSGQVVEAYDYNMNSVWTQSWNGQSLGNEITYSNGEVYVTRFFKDKGNYKQTYVALDDSTGNVNSEVNIVESYKHTIQNGRLIVTGDYGSKSFGVYGLGHTKDSEGIRCGTLAGNEPC